MNKKKIILIAGAALALLIIANFIIPLILDPNQYKAEITKKVEEKTGYKLEIAGNIKLSTLPFIKAYAEDISISTGSKTMATAKEIRAYVSILPLLSGRVEVGEIRVIEPNITLEKTETGNNWTAHKKEESAKTPSTEEAQSSKKEVKIDSISIIDGQISYNDKGKETKIEKINLNARLDSLTGPVSYEGKLLYKQKEVALKGSVENFSDPKINANVDFFGANANFIGGTKAGKIAVKSEDIKPLLAEFGKKNMFSMAKAPLDVSGDFSFENEQINISNLKAKLGSTEGIGAIVYAMPKDSFAQFAANLKFSKIYVDELMPPAKTTEEEKDNSDGPSKNKKGDGMLAEIQIASDQVLHKKGVYNNFYAKINIDNKQISVEPVSINLPGGGEVKLFGILDSDSDSKAFDGRIEISSDNLRKLVESFDTKLNSFQAGKPGAFALNSNLAVRLNNNKSIDLTQMNGKLQNSNFNGNLFLKLGAIPEISYTGGIDNLNLDEILTKSSPSETDNSKPGQKTEGKKLDLSWLTNFGQKVKINAAIGQLKKDAKNYANVKFEGSIEKGLLDINNFYFNSDKIDAGGKIQLNAVGARPKISVNLNIDKIDTTIGQPGSADTSSAGNSGERWSQKAFNFSPLEQIDGDFKAKIGSLILKSGTMTNVSVIGYLENSNLNIQKLNANLYDGSLEAKGKLAIAGVPSFDLNFNGNNFSLPKIVRGVMKNERMQQGIANITGAFKSSGVNQKNMVENLGGTAGITAQGIVVQGYDLQGFAYQINNINGPADLLTLANIARGENKSTRIDSVSGNFYAEKGVISTQGINMDATYARGVYIGSIDLPRWYMDTKADFKLTSADKKESPAVGFKISGPLDAPKLSPQLDEISRWAAERIAKGLIKKNVIPEKYQGIVDVFTGKQPSAAQQPAPDATNPAAEPQQPATQQQQIIDLFGKLTKKPKK